MPAARPALVAVLVAAACSGAPRGDGGGGVAGAAGTAGSGGRAGTGGVGTGGQGVADAAAGDRLVPTRDGAGGEPATDGSVMPGARPNVVLVISDDLGYADLGSYGLKDGRTPNLDRLAAEGVRLTDFYAATPVCSPTRAALMTGRYQQRAGIVVVIPPGDPNGLAASETSLATVLQQAGYATGAFGKWHLGATQAQFRPNAHGFDRFFGFREGNIDYDAHTNPQTGRPDLWLDEAPVVRSGYVTDLINTEAVNFVNQNAARPFFLYLAHGAVHRPLLPPPGAGGGDDRAKYLAMLARMDDGVGMLMAALDRHGIAGNTIFIFTNDNGGVPPSSNSPLRGNKNELWEGGIRTPCVVRWPGRIPAGTVSRQQAGTFDLSATILGATATSLPAGRFLDGLDLMPWLSGAEPAVERTLVWTYGGRAVRRGPWKYHSGGAGAESLYHLDSDIGESRDVAAANPAVVASLRAEHATWRNQVAAQAPFDADQDGLPDNWEVTHFRGLGETAAGDPDGDGRTNLDEYRAGTSPTRGP